MSTPTETRCPMCGNQNWAETEHDVVLREADPRVIRGGGLQADAFVCTKCRFVRLHSREAASGQS